MYTRFGGEREKERGEGGGGGSEREGALTRAHARIPRRRSGVPTGFDIRAH